MNHQFDYLSGLSRLLSTPDGRYLHSKWKKKAIEAVSLDGNRLAYESEWWQRDEHIVRAAIINNPFAIRHAPLFQNDKKMGLLAVRINGLAWFCLNPELQRDSEIREKAQRHIPKSHSAPFKREELYYSLDNCPEIQPISNINPMIKGIQLIDKSSRYIRDSHVTLFEGGHLIPYSIKDPLHKKLLRAMIPHYFPVSETGELLPGMTGKGYAEKNVAQAMITAIEHGISFKQGKTCIEGGNCFLFMSKNQKKAVIGEVSLYLSMMALDEQGAFDIVDESDQEPSEEAYRITRNLAHYQKVRKPQDEKRDQEKKKRVEEVADGSHSVALISEDFVIHNPRELIDEELDYHKQLTASLSEADREKYRKDARQIKLKLELTKVQIANELGVPLANIAFIPQKKFHIDMELFVTPRGKVILHDDQKALQLLEDIRKTYNLCDEENDLFQQYQINAEHRLIASKLIHERQKELLQRSGIDFDTLPAVFEASKRSALNYCNGIFIENRSRVLAVFPNGGHAHGIVKEKGFTYITTGASSPHEVKLHNRFLRIFNETFPEYTVKTIPMSHFVAKYSAGIHCLTFESDLPIESNV